MSKMKGYIERNVLEESKNRLRHILNLFDKVYVLFSGGKDSLVVLHLLEELYAEMGISEPLNIIFRDEEIIPDDVIAFVTKYHDSGKYNFKYFAVPLKSQKFMMGKSFSYVQWDENREWVRPKPDFAIQGDGKTIYDQYSIESLMTEGDKGRVALLTGIRADESLIRFHSCINKRNENYINNTQQKNVKLCKPIYDWTERDVFKYFYEREIAYCRIYDLQMWNKDELRVATPLHAESAKRFKKLRSLYPTYYEQIVSVFPEMMIQDRYWDEYDRYGIINKYEASWNGILRYIKEQITDPTEQKLATMRLLQVKKMRDKRLREEPTNTNYGGYPLLHVFKTIVDGGFKRVIQPKKIMNQRDKEYEGRMRK